jgi:hypothetical protein
MFFCFLTTTPLHRNKFCFTGGMIEGELDFAIDPIAATLHLFF